MKTIKKFLRANGFRVEDMETNGLAFTTNDDKRILLRVNHNYKGYQLIVMKGGTTHEIKGFRKYTDVINKIKSFIKLEE